MSFAPQSKKQRTAKASNGTPKEFFPHIQSVKYEGLDTENILAFRHYNPEEVVEGKTMKEWCRFSMCYWHTFRGMGADPFGHPTMDRSWDDGTESVENAKNRLRAAFEVFQKLGLEYYTFHDVDIAPAGETLEETNRNLDEVTDLALELQKETGIKLLWGTANLFSHPRYMNGAATNPDAHVVAHAAAQVKKMMEVTLKLGGENFVFWGGREGYQSLLNTNIKKELDHAGRFFQMVVDYKKKLGAKFQLLIEPKPREPTKHQYDYDAQTVMCFLKTYGLDNDFKVNIEPNHTTLAGHEFEHDVLFASKFGFLGSIDSNTGDTLLGWDTDQFPMEAKKTCRIMEIVMDQGGLAPGGLNFDCKVRRESTLEDDIFIAHVGAMDCFAQGLKAAAKIRAGKIPKLVAERYASFDSGIGAKIEKGQTSLEELHNFIVKNGEPTQRSAQQEKFELLYNTYF